MKIKILSIATATALFLLSSCAQTPASSSVPGSVVSSQVSSSESSVSSQPETPASSPQSTTPAVSSGSAASQSQSSSGNASSSSSSLSESSQAVSQSLPSSSAASESEPEPQPSGSLTMTFMDSNGFPFAGETVTCYIVTDTGEMIPGGTLGTTDQNGQIVLTYMPILGTYCFEMPDFEKNHPNVRFQDGLLGLAPLLREYKLTELGKVDEVTFTVKVFPLIEQTISENCLVFTLYDRNGDPVVGQRIFCLKPLPPEVEEAHIVDLRVHLGLTDEEGKVVYHDPQLTGTYTFLYPLPERPGAITLYPRVPFEVTTLEGVQEFRYEAPEYPMESFDAD